MKEFFLWFTSAGFFAVPSTLVRNELSDMDFWSGGANRDR